MSGPEHVVAPIGAQIRDLRKSHRLTLQELADAVGSSAPAIHRYESHWEGYTVRTLRRIAEALDADLEVRLSPRVRAHAPESPGEQPMERDFLEQIRNLHWDVDLTVVHLTENALWILTRILNEGSLPQVRSALAYYGPAPFREVLGRRDLSARARSFLTALLKERA
jgi:transcriptional regulator with XRE-family HTH domain